LKDKPIDPVTLVFLICLGSFHGFLLGIADRINYQRSTFKSRIGRAVKLGGGI
jgi:hypothetical protein